MFLKKMKKKTHFLGNLRIWDMCCFGLGTIPLFVANTPPRVSFWGITITPSLQFNSSPPPAKSYFPHPLTGNFPRKLPKQPTAHNAHWVSVKGAFAREAGIWPGAGMGGSREAGTNMTFWSFITCLLHIYPIEQAVTSCPTPHPQQSSAA